MEGHSASRKWTHHDRVDAIRQVDGVLGDRFNGQPCVIIRLHGDRAVGGANDDEVMPSRGDAERRGHESFPHGETSKMRE